MYKRLFLAKFFISLCLLSQTGAGAKTIQVKGRVFNGTHNKGLAAAPVELWRLNVSSKGASHGAKLLGETKTDAAGNFVFPPRDVAAADLLTVRSTWQGYPYEMPAYDGAGTLHQKFGVAVQPDKVVLQVLDVAKTLSVIEKAHHIAIESGPRGLKCTERIVLENPTGKVFLGEGPDQVSYRLSLPTGAQDVKVDPKILDARLVKNGNSYGVSMPLWPSQNDNNNALIITYRVDWAGTMPWSRNIDLSRKLFYPVRFFFVNRTESDRNLKVAAPQLGPDQDQQIPVNDQPQVRIVNAKGFPMSPQPVFEAGTEVAVNVSRPVNGLFWAFLMFVVALVCLVPMALLGKPKSGPGGVGKKVAKTGEPVPVSYVIQGTNWAALEPSHSARDLIEKIAQLDEEWERGVVSAEEYRTRRGEWKSRLIRELGAASAGENQSR